MLICVFQTGDLLKHKIQHRPDRQVLVQQHILEGLCHHHYTHAFVLMSLNLLEIHCNLILHQGIQPF